MTITDNSNYGISHGANYYGPIIITNSIIRNNYSNNIFATNGIDSILISYSNIQDGWEGEGNIDANPLFCNPANGDYSLSENSPCVGTGENGTDMGAVGIGCEVPLMLALNDNFELFEGRITQLNILDNDYNIDLGSISSIEIVSPPFNATATVNSYTIDFEPYEGYYGADSFSYAINFGSQSDTADVSVYVYLSFNIISYQTSGQIEGGLTMLDDNSLYAVSSNDAVYRFDSNLNYYYYLDVAGEINGASTITYDHTIYIGSTDQNLYSFNSSGVTNPNWPRSMGSEVTASVTVDNSGNIYVGTHNGVFQAISPNNETIWAYNCGAPIYASSAISLDNKMYICTSDGRILCFDLITLDAASPAFDWILSTGSDILSSPALDIDGFIYVGLMDGRLIKVENSGSIVWEVQTGGSIISSPVIDSYGRIYIGTTDGSLFSISPDGYINWSVYLGSEINSTPAIDDIGNIYFGSNGSYLYGVDTTGVIFTKIPASSSVNSSILCSNGAVYFGDDSGMVNKVTLNFDRIFRNVNQPIWGTFQGNNQRTGNQSDLYLKTYENDSFIPKSFALHQNFPNPFNPITTINYQIPKATMVNISIYNVGGQLIETLVSEHKNVGYHSIIWNANGVSSGVYFYRIEAGEYTETKKCLILK